MGSDLGICANIVRFFLVIINGFFIVSFYDKFNLRVTDSVG